MATNWFDALDEKDATAGVDLLDANMESEDTTTTEKSSADEGKGKDNDAPKARNDKSMWVLAGGVVVIGVVLVPVLGKGLEAIVSGDAESNAAAVAGPAAVVTQSPVSANEPGEAAEPTAKEETAPLALSDKTEIGPACKAGSDEVAEEKSVRGAATEFERAYFLRDAERLINVTTKESPLREQDWPAILPEAAPDGTKWCASFAPIQEGATTVELDLLMHLPDQEPATFSQVVTGQDTPDGWKIVQIDPRGE